MTIPCLFYGGPGFSGAPRLDWSKRCFLPAVASGSYPERVNFSTRISGFQGVKGQKRRDTWNMQIGEKDYRIRRMVRDKTRLQVYVVAKSGRGQWRNKCEDEKCVTEPQYGDPFDGIKRRCRKHKRDSDIYMGAKLCEHSGCNLQATFGDPNDPFLQRRFCMKHKREEDINLRSKRCASPECQHIAMYGKMEDKVKKWCRKHKQDGDVNLVSKRCEHGDCDSVASFGNPTFGSIRWCAQHKREGDENLRTKQCEHPGCKTSASFGDPVDGVRRWCKKHKRPDDQNLILLSGISSPDDEI